MSSRNQKFDWVRLATMLTKLAGAAIFFFGNVNWIAAMVYYQRFGRFGGKPHFSPGSPQFGSAEDVAHQGFLYGVCLVALGLAVFAVGHQLDRLLDRKIILKKQRDDVLNSRRR